MTLTPETLRELDTDIDWLAENPEGTMGAKYHDSGSCWQLIDRMRDRLLAAHKEREAEMLRVKACEHIAEGDKGWEALRNECPSSAAVAGLRDNYERLLATARRAERMEKALREISWECRASLGRSNVIKVRDLANAALKEPTDAQR